MKFFIILGNFKLFNLSCQINSKYNLIHLAITIASVVADDCSYDEVKKCYNLEYMFSDGKFQWPTDDGSVQTLCGKLLEGGQCFKAFVDKCSKFPAAKEEFNKKLAALKLYHQSVCDSPDGRKGFLDRVQCYSNPNVVAPLKVKLYKRLTNFTD